MKKYEEQIINYLIGGIIPLIVLLPFLCVVLSGLYNAINGEQMSAFLVSIITCLSFFILFTIAIGAVTYRMKKKEINVPESINFYFKLVPFITFLILLATFVELKMIFFIAAGVAFIISFALMIFLKQKKLFK